MVWGYSYFRKSTNQYHTIKLEWRKTYCTLVQYCTNQELSSDSFRTVQLSLHFTHMLVLYQFVIAYQYSRPSLRNITDAEYARSISDSAHIPTVHSGTEPGPHGFGLGFCASALMILYILVLEVCHMTDKKCMISVTETIRDTVAHKKKTSLSVHIM